jgi:hypothetical protein
MNKELEGREFILPEDVIKHLQQHTSTQQTNDPDGIMRSKNLLSVGKVNYGQLKRIIHDLKYIDRENELNRFNLYGGKPMEEWGNLILSNERNLISNNKDSRKRADNIGGITGERKNSHLKKHSKKPDFLPPLNMMKSNSHKTSVSPITSLGLFENINRIKKLML